MAFPQGIDFRATAGFVTDPTNYDPETSNDAAANYPRVTAQGNTVGFTSSTNGGFPLDRNAGNDARLAGMFTDSNANLIVYEIDLPATGSYDIGIADGDASYARSNQKIEVFDTTTSLGVLFSGVATGGVNRFIDATGTVYAAANWPGSNTTVSKTFTTTKAVFKIGNGANNAYIASIFMQAASASDTLMAQACL